MQETNFEDRHIGPRQDEINAMIRDLGLKSIDELIEKTIPADIRMDGPLDLPEGTSEYRYIHRLKEIAAKNKVFRSYIGLGYYDTIFPAVIQRNMLENPAWYTPYTPYQAEISQGRLEALLNFQTAVAGLAGMELANASLLDESTAAAEAMIMLFNSRKRDMVKQGADTFLVDKDVFPQTWDVVQTRALNLGIEVKEFDPTSTDFPDDAFGLLLQYPNGNGEIIDYSSLVRQAKEKGLQVAVAADLMSLALLVPPGEWGADVVLGSSQRFGIPMGYGGPHAAYFATRESYKRALPGRIIGVSVDVHGNPALRMALQTREQHIKRERATSNICTAQALLASMAGMYAVYHGSEGIKQIAERIHSSALMLEQRLTALGYQQENKKYFDTLRIRLPEGLPSSAIKKIATEKEVNFRYINNSTVGISVDETTFEDEINLILEVFAIGVKKKFDRVGKIEKNCNLDKAILRTSAYLTEEVFKNYRSETLLMRYIKKLELKDYSLVHSMIPLGSCTMKLNAAIEMLALSWEEFGRIHPFVPIDQTEGYQQLLHELGKFLMGVTGFRAVSFQPNSGASGEYTGLLVIKEYLKSKGEGHRNVVLIPSSAHGTNPASGVMAGMKVVVVDCDGNGNIDVNDLRSKASEHGESLAAFMVTYPSTHGVFEMEIKEMLNIVHSNGGQVYMDGANMNAQVGLTSPAIIGADVCHLNLHKTFAIPHGGGGPGMGPIAVAEHLVEFLPTHPIVPTGGKNGIGAIAAAPWGSASILAISHAYCHLLGGEGLTSASKIAILNANYLANALKEHYGILYKGKNGNVAHEMILDCRPFREGNGVTEADIAKRLMDYGFHAPTLSFPVHGTLMVEPTESESKAELDRFIEAMQSIHAEIMAIKEGKVSKDDNLLKNAPHTSEMVSSDKWEHSYSRKEAAFPLPWIRDNKLWPSVGRIDDAYGDRNLVCSCVGIEEYR
jgi:glycine dehydrogenase